MQLEDDLSSSKSRGNDNLRIHYFYNQRQPGHRCVNLAHLLIEGGRQNTGRDFEHDNENQEDRVLNKKNSKPNVLIMTVHKLNITTCCVLELTFQPIEK